jgi:hypothetical protein
MVRPHIAVGGVQAVVDRVAAGQDGRQVVAVPSGPPDDWRFFHWPRIDLAHRLFRYRGNQSAFRHIVLHHFDQGVGQKLPVLKAPLAPGPRPQAATRAAAVEHARLPMQLRTRSAEEASLPAATMSP